MAAHASAPPTRLSRDRAPSGKAHITVVPDPRALVIVHVPPSSCARVRRQPCFNRRRGGLDGEQLLFHGVMKITRQPCAFFAAGGLANLRLVSRAQHVHARMATRLCLRIHDGERRKHDADDERCPHDDLGQHRREQRGADPREQDAANDVSDRESIQAATSRLGVFEPRKRERDQCRMGKV